MTRRHAVKKEQSQSSQEPPNGNQRRSPSPGLSEQVHKQRYHAPENCGGSFPMKGILQQPSHTTKSSDSCSQKRYYLIKNPEKNTMTAGLAVVCAPVAGLRVPSCCRCPWQPQCLSPLGHRSLEHALVSAPFQSVPLLPRSKKQDAPRNFRYWSEK